MSNADDLHDLSSRLALRALADDYAAGCDHRDAELYVGVFHEDATLVVHATGDPDTIATEHRGQHQLGTIPGMLARYDRTYHFVGNTRYEIRGNDATGEVYCVAHHLSTRDTGRRDLVMYIRYLDAYRRVDSRWGIDERRVMIDWVEQRDVLPD
jgi:hypothetical protein